MRAVSALQFLLVASEADDGGADLFCFVVGDAEDAGFGYVGESCKCDLDLDAGYAVVAEQDIWRC